MVEQFEDTSIQSVFIKFYCGKRQNFAFNLQTIMNLFPVFQIILKDADRVFAGISETNTDKIISF